MNPKEEKYICKIHGIFLSEKSKSLEFTLIYRYLIRKKHLISVWGKQK
jgi:hypothetical protein